MIKCLECGFETETRLQWSHFKYKCTGKFKNGVEYQTAHPDAPIIDPSLRVKYAITEENMKIKYGNDDGAIRWKRYCDKQANTNSFEYKHEKYGWTVEQFKEYNSSRAQTLSKMIERHGESKGSLKWITYCERQAYTNTKSYFINKYGTDTGIKKYIELNHKKSAPHDPLQISSHLGITIDEAVQLIIARQNRNGFVFGSNLEREFTDSLEQRVGKLDHTSSSSPYGKWSHLLNSYVLYDIKHGDCVIEFNGDYWHANPKIYKDDAEIRGRTAKVIQEHDCKKLQTAVDLGFRVLTVWEAEYKANKQETINKVIKWMQSGQQ
jgi:very-short-patch-repair endonuclease